MSNSLTMFSPCIIAPPETFSLDPKNILSICENLSGAVGLSQNGTVHIAFLEDREIQSLNKQYRGIDATTDVLSFHYFDDFSFCKKSDVAGEIVLSESRVTLQAGEHGHSLEKETSILILHALLHLLGYDHETDEDYEEMWSIEKELRESIFS